MKIAELEKFKPKTYAAWLAISLCATGENLWISSAESRKLVLRKSGLVTTNSLYYHIEQLLKLGFLERVHYSMYKVNFEV